MSSKEKEIFLKNIGEHIKRERLKKGISGAELSRMIFMDKPNLTRIEKGRVNPSLYVIKQICIALELPLAEFFKDFKD